MGLGYALLPGMIAGAILHFGGGYEHGELQLSKPLGLISIIITSLIWMGTRPAWRKWACIIVTAIVFGLLHRTK